MTPTNQTVKNLQGILNKLKNKGFCLVKNVLENKECKTLIKHLDEMMTAQEAEGNESLTVNMPHLRRPKVFLPYLNKPEILKINRAVLGVNCILTAISGFTSDPDGGDRVHIDSRIPVKGFDNTFNVFNMVFLDRFHIKNGGTIVFPMSHLTGIDPRYIRDETDFPGSIAVEGERGDMFVMLTQTWHDVGPNISGQRRWGLGVQYNRSWHKPGFDFTRCGPDIYKILDEEQKWLFGFGLKRENDISESESFFDKELFKGKSYEELMNPRGYRRE